MTYSAEYDKDFPPPALNDIIYSCGQEWNHASIRSLIYNRTSGYKFGGSLWRSVGSWELGAGSWKLEAETLEAES